MPTIKHTVINSWAKSAFLVTGVNAKEAFSPKYFVMSHQTLKVL